MKYNSIEAMRIFNDLHMYKNLVIEAINKNDNFGIIYYKASISGYIEALLQADFLTVEKWHQLTRLFERIIDSKILEEKKG